MKHSQTIISRPKALPDPIMEPVDEVLALLEIEGTEQAHELTFLTVPVPAHGKRLDLVLTQLLGSFSRSYVQQRLACGDVTVNGQVAHKPSAKACAGDEVQVALRETMQSQAFKPQDLPLVVVYEDSDLLVIDKAAGMVVHPAPGNWQGTLLNGLLFRDAGAVNLPRAGIVHRLDKDTSGLMVVAKNRKTMDALVKMISERAVHRQYLALSARPWGGSPQRQINSPIGRDPFNRVRMAVVDLGRHPGKQARTDFHCLATNPQGCVVQCTLHTGRTHQIRVHMASLAHPLLGDTIYGGVNGYGMERQALHAFRLAFEHPVTQNPLCFTSEVPADFDLAVQKMGLRYNSSAPRDGAMANE